MKRLLPAALCLLLLNGCLFWNKKPSSKPKESPKVATGVEQDFKQRWVDKRASDLVLTGVSPSAAHDQAVSEFDQKFSETHVADPAK